MKLIILIKSATENKKNKKFSKVSPFIGLFNKNSKDIHMFIHWIYFKSTLYYYSWWYTQCSLNYYDDGWLK